MALTNTDLRLFGLDLRKLGQTLAEPWRNLSDLPGLGWLTPQVPVHVLRVDGSECLVQDGRFSPWPAEGQKGVVRKPALALELPTELCLFRTLSIPLLSEAEMREALELEASTYSPFPAEDLVLGYQQLATQEGSRKVVLAISSRRRIQTYLDAQQARLSAAARKMPEIWVFPDLMASAAPSNKPLFVPLQGFGETGRLQRLTQGRRLRLALLALALAWLLPLAVTPTIQLRARALAAQEQFLALSRRVAPYVAEREALVKFTDALNSLSSVLQERVEPLRVIELLTQTLPDDTWLQSLQIQGSKITMGGLTPNAAALMQKLSSEPLFKDVKAPTAAVRQSGSTKEAFTIEFTLDTKAMRANDPIPPAPPPRPRDPNRSVLAPSSGAGGGAGSTPPPALAQVQPPRPTVTPEAAASAGAFGVLLGPTPKVNPAPLPMPVPPQPPVAAAPAPAPQPPAAPAPASAPAPAAGSAKPVDPFSIGGGVK